MIDAGYYYVRAVDNRIETSVRNNNRIEKLGTKIGSRRINFYIDPSGFDSLSNYRFTGFPIRPVRTERLATHSDPETTVRNNNIICFSRARPEERFIWYLVGVLRWGDTLFTGLSNDDNNGNYRCWRYMYITAGRSGEKRRRSRREIIVIGSIIIIFASSLHDFALGGRTTRPPRARAPAFYYVNIVFFIRFVSTVRRVTRVAHGQTSRGLKNSIAIMSIFIARS